jgi:hypothetical protein
MTQVTLSFGIENMTRQGEIYIPIMDPRTGDNPPMLTEFFLLPECERRICGCTYVGRVRCWSKDLFYPIHSKNAHSQMYEGGRIRYQLEGARLVRIVQD